jgi:chromosome segregation ATPase
MQDDLKLAMGNAETAISKLEDERDRLAAELAAARERRRFGHRHLKMLIQKNAQHLDEAIARKNERAQRLRDLAPQLARRIESDLHSAQPHTPESLADLDRRFAVAEGRVRDARAASELRAERARELTAEIGQLRREPGPAAADSELVSDARARDLPRKVAERPGWKRGRRASSATLTSWKVNMSASFPGCGGRSLRFAGKSFRAPASSPPRWPCCG